MLNKKLLKESIMKGVKESLNSNKALNEGLFSSWKEENAPTFPLDKFIENTKPFIKLIEGYIKNKYAENLSFAVYVDKKGAGLSTYFNNGEDIIIKGIENLKAQCKQGDDQFNRALYKTKLFVTIPESSALGKFVKSTVSTWSSKVNGAEDVLEFSKFESSEKGTLMTLYVNATTFLDDEKTKKVMDYFS